MQAVCQSLLEPPPRVASLARQTRFFPRVFSEFGAPTAFRGRRPPLPNIKAASAVKVGRRAQEGAEIDLRLLEPAVGRRGLRRVLFRGLTEGQRGQ